MTRDQLRRKINRLREHQPLTVGLERELASRGTITGVIQYASQKQHWLGWLGEYNSPGFYGRRDWNRTAEFVYNHVVCPPMVLWLGEAVGIPTESISAAVRAALAAPANMMSQSSAIRGTIPWSEIDARLSGQRVTRGGLPASAD